MNCPICLQIIKNPIMLKCNHTYCLSCIRKWNNYSDKCPICRKNITDELDSKYNLRRKLNGKNILELKDLINKFYDPILSKEERVLILDKVFKFISEHKFIFSHNTNFRKVTLEKINDFKYENIPQAYYWDNLINSYI